MNKKSQGLSINVIIIVAIALIVLVVLVAIFTGRLAMFTGGIKGTTTCSISCQGIGQDSGNSIDKEAACDGSILPGSYGDVNKDQRCCCIASE